MWLGDMRGITTQDSDANEDGQEVKRVRQSGTTGPWIWIKQRGWIKPRIDLTGAVDATDAINAAYAVRNGVCVSIPDGNPRVNGQIVMSRGSALIGRPNGMNFGHKQYNVANNIGSRIDLYGTSLSAIVPSEQCTIQDLCFYHPNQVTNATPTVYPWVIDAAPGSGVHGLTLNNLVGINPYKFIRVAVNGAKLDTIQGQPLSRGIMLGRCADVVRMNKVHFNAGGVFGAAGATLLAWMAANLVNFSIDGAENFDATDCFAYGGLYGLLFRDEDADTFAGSYGSWKGGGFDVCAQAIRVENYALRDVALSATKIANTSTGKAIEFVDTVGGQPLISASEVTFWGNYAAAVDITAASSTGVYKQDGGKAVGGSGAYFRARADGGSAILLSNVGMPSGATRTSGPNVIDRSQWVSL